MVLFFFFLCVVCVLCVCLFNVFVWSVCDLSCEAVWCVCFLYGCVSVCVGLCLCVLFAMHCVLLWEMSECVGVCVFFDVFARLD